MQVSRPLVVTAVEVEARAVRRAVGELADVVAAGVRAVRMPDLAGRTVVIVAGLAGALDPDLHEGDVVVDNWPAGWAVPGGARAGRIVTAEYVCATPADKARLLAQTGALAVDMEQAIVLRAAPPGVTVIGVRAILDTAGQCLDPALARLVDPMGNPRLAQVARHVLRRPTAAVELARLGRASSRACRRAGAVVAACVEALGDNAPPPG